MPEEKKYTDRLRHKASGEIYHIYDSEAVHQLKTINGESLVGTGDIQVQTSQLTNNAFSETWPVGHDSTIVDFVNAINNDNTAVVGMSYLGHVSWGELSELGLGSAEILVEVMYQYWEGNKVIHFVLTSGDTAPYRWERTIWNSGNSDSGWISFQPANAQLQPEEILPAYPVDFNDGEKLILSATKVNGQVVLAWKRASSGASGEIIDELDNVLVVDVDDEDNILVIE